MNGRSTPVTGRGTPTRQLQGTPTRQHPGIPPRSWTDSPSRASTSTHQAIGVPMTQVSSRPRTLSTQTRGQQVESGVSESEPESLAFPGSTSTLSLPGDVSLSEVSPFTAPKELESSSESERPSPWIGPGVTSSPWVNPRASSSSSGSPWMGTNSIELLGGSGMLMNSSLPKLTESPSPRNSAETTRPKGGKHSRNGSNLGHSRAGSTVGHERNGSATGHERNGPVVGHERNGSSSRPGSSVGHSRPGSTMTHSRTGSYTHPGLGLRTGQDILVPMISPSKAISRSDVMRLVGRGDSFDSSREEPTSPRPSALSTVAEYNQPKPIFMVPGADPAKVSSTSRPKSMAHVEEEQSLHGRVASEDSEESVILNQDGQAMVRTTEVGVGAGRARVQTGVGIGVSRSRGGSVIKSKTDSGLRKRVDSGKSEPRARADSTKSNESRPRVSNVPRPKIENVRRKPVSSGSQSPVTGSPATPTSASTTSARRFLVRKASSEAPSRTRKTSNASMRKSSTSSLRSTPPTTVSSPSARKSTRTTSFSSGASTPRSNGALSPRMRTASGSGNATPKAGTPRTSISSGRSSIASPKSNLVKSSTSPPKAAPSTATPKAAPRPLPPRPGPPPVRPQRSALRPNLRASVTIPPAPVPSSSATTTPTSSGPPRTRAVTMDVQPTSPTHADPRPRRTTSISSKPPPVSRSGMSSAPTAPTPIVSRPMNRTSVHSGFEHPSNDVPFPSPESKHSLQVPEPQPLKRSLSVSSAARKLVGRTRSGSPVPPTPPVETASIAQSTDASSIEKSPQKGTRSLSRLAFSALLPKRGSNNAAAEAKAALAQAKAREVAEAKARAKAAVEDAKARAKAEAEDAKAARAVKSKEEKEAKKSSKRFGSISRRGEHTPQKRHQGTFLESRAELECLDCADHRRENLFVEWSVCSKARLSDKELCACAPPQQTPISYLIHTHTQLGWFVNLYALWAQQPKSQIQTNHHVARYYAIFSTLDCGPKEHTVPPNDLGESGERLLECQYFPLNVQNPPGPNYLISPEERINAASRLDLYITRLNWDGSPPSPVAVYEGKGATAGDTWDSIRRQLHDYGQAITTQMPRIPGVYLIGAKGQSACFWFYKTGYYTNPLPILVQSGSRVIVKDSSQLPPVSDVGTGFPDIDDILRFIRVTPDPRVTR
ncbi:hypothetical protein AG1IA_05457 [Rhizoctonia solani AG-1 IA]|uniref:Uncharacterized protein n=1 Tax=Thanatephorus cucumeris (strain AG1-IA) TaxID=983506 RepID=L8WVY0_THACA|nr:hypothetical protein AG1IA_05457 [Rhizoctonia solani AG-1 IA]